MDCNNNEIEVEVDSCNNLISQDPFIETQNAENNLPADKNETTLIETREKSADLNRSHTIPIVTVWCLLSLFYPIISHVFDFVSDIRLILDYFENQKTVQASLTLAFTILQAIASVWISFLMHHPKLGKVSADEEDDKTNENRVEKMAKITVHYGIVIMFQRALPLCHLRKLYYAWRLLECQRRKDEVLQNRYHRRMLEEDRDSVVLEVMECFLQSAPQLILQLYILLTQDTAISDPMWTKIFSGCVTLFTLGQTMKNYHCAVRLAQPDKALIGEIGGVLLMLWHLGTIAARILVIGVAASSCLLNTLSVCVVNWIAWTVWIHTMENVVSILHGKKVDTSKFRNLLLASVMAVVYTFTFINVGKGRTFVRNSVYYIVCLLQNGTVFVLWFLLTKPTMQNFCLSQVLLIISVIFFFIGIVAMVIYYMFFHPTLQNRSGNSQC